MFEHILKSKSGVFRRLRQPRLKIIEARSKPRIMLTQFLHPQSDQVARKKLSQRRRYAFEKRPRPHQIEILISNKPSGRQNLARTYHLLAIEPGRFRQLDPAQDSPLAMLVTVVVHDAFPPDAPKRRISRTRKNDRVLHRNNRLVVITIQRPGLQL